MAFRDPNNGLFEITVTFRLEAPSEILAIFRVGRIFSISTPNVEIASVTTKTVFPPVNNSYESGESESPDDSSTFDLEV